MADVAYPDAERGSETILLAEDQVSVRSLIAKALKDRGYRVIEAENGEDAIVRAGEHAAPIHLVLTDVLMPELSGRDLFDKLRQWYPNLRVLFMSGYAAGAVSARVLQDERTGFIAKPFQMDQLALTIRGLLDQS